MRHLLLLLAALASLGCAQNDAPAGSETGLVRLHVTDAVRADDRAASGQREWRVDLYYPAQAGSGSAMRYGDDPELLSVLTDADYYGVPANEIALWADRDGAARRDGAAQPGRYRLILLSPGLGVAAFNYQILASELVEEGYAVAVVDHPYLGIGTLPDGRVQGAGDEPELADLGPDNSEAFVQGWARDLSVTLDFLGAADLPDGLDLDFGHVASAGHSLGGAVALDACHEDDRITACLNFEGAPFGSRLLSEGVSGANLIVLSRPRQEGEADSGGGPRAMLVDMLGRGDGDGWFVAVSGGGHMSYSDAPYVMPETLTRFGGTVMSADRSMDVYAGLTDAFLDAAWDGADFAAALDTLPEAEGEQAG